MHGTTYVKDTPVLMIFGITFIVFFGWLLRRNYQRFDFKRKYSRLFFILDNYELVGAVLIGIGLIMVAIFA
ncbi:hypothetical protein [Desulfosporosinus sp. Sb-LF]|uniref:hypothetical protein n=1 Tax=Desulfosporosinus sp. Sb-LF TaxID=2560027 RepID=UPI00107F285C|nr:hypothetical protein [Desulfosporosinus sp. Sb-LF]TGE32858.1 hypothetical protein E4K68_08390 [Desulfosporosinus sp. Sb-LF]